jgi:hypothetical protein
MTLIARVGRKQYLPSIRQLRLCRPKTAAHAMLAKEIDQLAGAILINGCCISFNGNGSGSMSGIGRDPEE